MPEYNRVEHRLVLGTAQLGMKYGIANKTGIPDIRTVVTIVETAWEAGMREFDTAQAYGRSEKVLGSVLAQLGIAEKAKIVSKLNPELDHLNSSVMKEALEKSIEHLGVARLYGLMLHREDLLDLWEKGLCEIISEYVKVGLVEHIGISVYSPQRANSALDRNDISIVQVPSNILDRRFESAGVFRVASDKDKQIYVRSVFLNGLLLMNIEDIPSNMKFAVSTLKMLDSVALEAGLKKGDLALGYVKQAYPEAKIIFGVESPEQLKENLNSWERSFSSHVIERVQNQFSYVEERILSPILWPK